MGKKLKKIPPSVSKKLKKFKLENSILKTQCHNGDSSPPLLKPELKSCNDTEAYDSGMYDLSLSDPMDAHVPYRALKEFTNEFFEWLKKSGAMCSIYAPDQFLHEFDMESFMEKYPCCRYELALKNYTVAVDRCILNARSYYVFSQVVDTLYDRPWRKLRKKFGVNGILLSERLDRMSTNFPQLDSCYVSGAIQKFLRLYVFNKDAKKLPKDEIMEQIHKEERSAALKMMRCFHKDWGMYATEEDFKNFFA